MRTRPHDAHADRDLVFVSYSRDDLEWMQAFRVMLAPVLGKLGYRLWVDTDLRVGEEWDPQLEAAIERSAAALLLISPRFLASTYIRDRELPALRLHGVRLAPVLIGECGYTLVLPEVAAVQWLHDPGRDGPLNLHADQPGERDRRIWQASEKLLALLPRRASPSAPQQPRRDAAAVPVAVPEQGVPGRLSGVPAPPPGYVARGELAGLIEAITAGDTGAVGVVGPPVGLHGQGGIGKSVLAAAVARTDGVRHQFPDGIFWVTVGQAGNLLAAQLDLLTRLEPTATPPGTAAEAEQALRDALADRRVLMIVDDVWSDAAALAFRLTGPQGRVLYTTRDMQVLAAAGARSFPVDVLTLAAARALAAAVLDAGGDAQGLTAAADAAIEQVERVALAVALLAAAVRGGRRTWAQVADELARDADVFGDHPYANTFKAMQVAVAALPDGLSEALRSLAVFPPDTRTPITAIARYWRHTRAATAAESQDVLDRLAAANTLTLTLDRPGDPPLTGNAATVEFHDLQHEYLMLHARALPTLHAGLLDAFRDRRAGLDQWWRLDPDEPYLWDHLAGHLRGAGARRELAVTFADPLFLLHRLALAGVLATEDDLAAVAGPLVDDPTIAWWRGWLPRHAHLFTIDLDTDDRRERVRRLAPTLRVWLAVDPTRPAVLDPDRLRQVAPPPALVARHGPTSPPGAQVRVLTGHIGGVSAVAWSPDGTRLATGGGAGIARIWDPVGGHPVATLAGLHAGVNAMAWSPDGTRLATGSNDSAGTWMWETTGGRSVLALTDFTGGTRAVAWSPDGTRLLSVSNDGDLWMWDAVGGRSTELLSGGVRAVAWSPDGTRLATVSWVSAHVWGVVGDGLTTEPTELADDVTAVAWSPDGARLAIASSHGGVRMWDAVSGEITATPIGPTRSLRALAWSPDGTRLTAIDGPGGVVLTWDLADEEVAATVTDHAGARAVAWSPDGTRLATGGDDNARIWDPFGGRRSTSPEQVGRVGTIVCSPDGTRIATTGAAGDVSIWDAAGAPEVMGLVDPPRGRAVAWSPDGRRLAIVVGEDGAVLWDTATGQVSTRLMEHDRWGVQAVAWSPDGERLAIVDGNNGAVTVRDAATGRVTTRLTESTAATAWSPDGTRLATVGNDLEVRIWEVAPTRPRRWYQRLRPSPLVRLDALRPGPWQLALVWAAAGVHIAVSYPDGTMQTWNPLVDHGVTATPRRAALVNDIVWAPTGDRLAAMWTDGVVTIHHPDTLAETGRLHLGSVTAIDWSRRGLAVGTQDPPITVLDLVTGSPVP